MTEMRREGEREEDKERWIGEEKEKRKETGDEEGGRDLCSWVGSAE